MSNHLIPTARTDKNGNTVIRHMRPEEAAPSRTTMIPAVQVTKPQTPQEKVNEIAELIADFKTSNMDFPDLVMYLHYIEENSSKTLPILKRCLTTGNDEAQEITKSLIHMMLDTIKENIDSSGGEDGSEDDEYGDQFSWADNCPEVWYPFAAANALCFWNTSNVMEEIGTSEDNVTISYKVRDLADNLSTTDDERSPTTDKYWRGMAAFTLTGIETPRLHADARQELKSFIPWAGKHEEIAAVTRVVRERGIFDQDTINQIIESQKDISPAVSSGTL
jgi:hypothetical protein